jgi:hypothetical protein
MVVAYDTMIVSPGETSADSRSQEPGLLTITVRLRKVASFMPRGDDLRPLGYEFLSCFVHCRQSGHPFECDLPYSGC